MKVRYCDGYRFQLAESLQLQTGITATTWAGNSFVALTSAGLLTIAAGYAWDGASGPVPQTARVIRASLLHDALYQLMRECGLSAEWRKAADELFRDACIADGMPRLIAWAYYGAVRAFGARHIDPSSRKPVLEAP